MYTQSSEDVFLSLYMAYIKKSIYSDLKYRFFSHSIQMSNCRHIHLFSDLSFTTQFAGDLNIKMYRIQPYKCCVTFSIPSVQCS